MKPGVREVQSERAELRVTHAEFFCRSCAAARLVGGGVGRGGKSFVAWMGSGMRVRMARMWRLRRRLLGLGLGLGIKTAMMTTRIANTRVVDILVARISWYR